MVCGSLSATNRVQLQFTIHVFVNCCFAHGVPWHQENHDKVLESVDNNELSERADSLSHFWGSCNKRLLLLIHVLAFLAIRAYPVGNSGSGYVVLSYKAGNRAPVLNVCTDNFSSGFVWYSSHVLFSSADNIILSGRGVTNSLYHYNSFGCFVWTQSLFGVGSERNSEWSSLDRTGIPYCFPTVSKLYEAVRIQLGYYIPEQAEIKRQGKCRKDGEEGDG